MDLDLIKKKVEKYKKEIIEDFGTDNEAIEKRITGIIYNSVNKVIYDLLGIKDDWGQFKVNTWCPSRRDNLPVFNYLRSEAGKVKVKELIEEIFGDFNLVLNKKEELEIKNSYKKEYILQLKKKLDELAKSKAEEDAEALFKQMIEES